MDLLYPTALLLLSIVPIVIVFLIWRNIARQRALRKIGNNDLVQQLISQVNYRNRRIKSFLWLMTLILLILALTHPIWGFSAEVITAEGTAILFIVDISRSMDAQDISPSRIERAKLDMLRITQANAGDDIGIIAFAGNPFVYMPLTYDTHAIETFTKGLTTQAISNQGTDIYSALELAVNTLIDYSVAEKIIILMSDGENHVFTKPESLQTAQDNGIIIHSVGYGTEDGAQIPLYNNDNTISGYQTDAGNAIVISTLQTQTLQDVAIATGGTYYTASTIDELVTELEDTPSGELGQRIFTQPIERFGIFLLLAIITLSVEILLPESRRTSI